ncbi:MAG: substrate-binding domain-containing protein [Kiritimatiellales bacterium]
MAQSKVVELIQSRIQHGDYVLNDIPGERSLAEEAGVSHMTARRAVQALIQEGVLERGSTGRLFISRSAKSTERIGKQIAFLVPNFPSQNYSIIHRETEYAAQAYGMRVRLVPYVHWDDPILLNALNSFDGIVLIPLPTPMPERVRIRFEQTDRPVVAMMMDMTELGIPSLIRTPTDWMDHLLDHLLSLGHCRIDCLNTQPLGATIQARINRWMTWRQENDVDGRAYNEPVAPFEMTAGRAYDVVADLIRSGEPVMPALLCTTLTTAIGAIRAFSDIGIRVGHEIAVATVSDEGLAQWTVPRITSLEWPNVKPQLSKCMDWIAGGGGRWDGPLKMVPKEPKLFIGDSTVPETE